jgi:hypothetical protein
MGPKRAATGRLELVPEPQSLDANRNLFSCGICGHPVTPKNGMWWNPDGTLHNFTCTGYGKRAGLRVE